jgi:hypothetical protein
MNKLAAKRATLIAICIFAFGTTLSSGPVGAAGSQAWTRNSAAPTTNQNAGILLIEPSYRDVRSANSSSDHYRGNKNA